MYFLFLWSDFILFANILVLKELGLKLKLIKIFVKEKKCAVLVSSEFTRDFMTYFLRFDIPFIL